MNVVPDRLEVLDTMRTRSRLAARAVAVLALVATATIAPTPHVGATVDTTPPVITTRLLSGSEIRNGWFSGFGSDAGVAVLEWVVSEPESPSTLVLGGGCGQFGWSGETTGEEFECTASSEGGVTEAKYTIRIDTATPLVSFTGGPEAGRTYLPETLPPLSCSATDETSGVAGGCEPIYSNLPGFQVAGATAIDHADNRGFSEGVPYYVVGITPTVTGTQGENGWFKSSAASLSWDVQAPDVPGATPDAGCDTVGSLPDTAGTTYTCRVVTDGGLVERSITVKQDTVAPAVAVAIGSGTFTVDQLPATLTCSATDGLSGVNADGCVVTGYSRAPGTHTVTATATDNAGNTTPLSYTYTVVPPTTVSGFYQPVDGRGVLNTVRAGRTVPLKFEVFGGTTEITDPSRVSVSVVSISCMSSAPTDAVTTTSTSASGLRYDTTAGQFVWNWRTPSTAGRCFRVTASSGGASTSADFKLT